MYISIGKTISKASFKSPLNRFSPNSLIPQFLQPYTKLKMNFLNIV